ncbi:MAG: Crp/Fnr family transcriptional regulator [Roseitalea sp.]|nr:Crp/Fnr family transcriptional regulator [Roseitalea sp.]MBO6950511.1 Crp/Fnr family transcriptional regulator [Rhizobiaceae bacterium]MBO6591502.1 Crp/Fnr family transcriptional regulator [Roseitalea sp.]MBO6599357.1 Crp/Fnr family transcriptional regulator [Roseitalea sp.]MBO6612154.1 Crp/Fnr family transcriptional regulator [Roseitalea sp.]
MAYKFKRSPFESLPKDMQTEIAGALARKTFAKGECIFRRGKPNTVGLYWLQRGVAIATRGEPQGDFGFAWPFYWGIWGAPSILGGEHTAWWTAVSSCEMDVLPLDTVKVLATDQAFNALLSTWAAEDLAISIRMSSILNEQRTELKVQHYLNAVARHALADPARRSMSTQARVSWPFSKTELARYLSVSRPHLSTVLSQLSERSAVRIDGRHLSVDPARLPSG